MGVEEELTAKIGELGDKIKAAKAENKAKEEWEPFLNEMLELKVSLQRHECGTRPDIRVSESPLIQIIV